MTHGQANIKITTVRCVIPQWSANLSENGSCYEDLPPKHVQGNCYTENLFVTLCKVLFEFGQYIRIQK